VTIDRFVVYIDTFVVGFSREGVVVGFIAVNDLSYCHPGGDFLFLDVAFRISEGDHVAFIGDNGVGKTTLFKILAGQLLPETGAVNSNGRILYMPQDVGLVGPEQTVREMLLDVAEPALREAGLRCIYGEREFERGNYEAGCELAEAIALWSDLGGYQLEGLWDASVRRIIRQPMSEVESRLTTTLSAGERKQLVLDFLLNSDADILLLDEPDNYLDIPAKHWLEQQVQQSTKTILLISHDREVLTNAVGKIVTLEGNGCWIYGGSYADYPDAREHRQELLAADLKRWQEEERRLFHFYKIMKERAKYNDANASKADAAETRWRRFVAIGPPTPPVPSQRVKIRFRGAESARRVVQIRSLGIDGLIQPFSTEVRFGERLGLIGPNGSGKTTILRLLAGEPLRHTGEIVIGNRVSAGLFSQVNNRSDFTARSILDITAERVGSEQNTMSALARYGLQAAARRPFETLSGGQKARLEILCLEAEGYNLLLLDEPTDNLDLVSLEALEGALDGFEGTVITVSHDRHFLKRLDRYLMVLHDGSILELLDEHTALAALYAPDKVVYLKQAKVLTLSE
jgi:ATPase subunit of ABC transporter with duplicated ATPase domains